MAVNKERVQLLVDALRSGEFQQGKNMLRTEGDTYCCLGVACEVARRNGIGIDWTRKDSCECEDCRDNRWSFDGTKEALGEAVAKWFGFEPDGHATRDPEIGHDEHSNIVTTIHANDDLGWNFLQIADAMETKYLYEEDRL